MNPFSSLFPLANFPNFPRYKHKKLAISEKSVESSQTSLQDKQISTT
jgi:hypothetical protein